MRTREFTNITLSYILFTKVARVKSEALFVKCMSKMIKVIAKDTDSLFEKGFAENAFNSEKIDFDIT